MTNQPPLNPDAFDLACKELFLTITAHKSAADVLGFDWKSLKASTRKPWETATRKVLTAYLEADGTAEELHEINTRLARILTDTANALKGEPEPLTSHSWHDLAEVAKRAVDGLREQVDAQSVDNHLAVAQPESEDERISAWHAVANHPAFNDCYEEERPLLESMLDHLTELTAQPVVNSVEELDALPDGAIVECLTHELVASDTLPIVVKQPGNWWHGGWDWECNISPKQLIPAKIIRLP